MKYYKLELLTVELFYEDSTSETKTFTKKEWAGFKRSKKYKTVLHKKSLTKTSIKISATQ